MHRSAIQDGRNSHDFQPDLRVLVVEAVKKVPDSPSVFKRHDVTQRFIEIMTAAGRSLIDNHRSNLTNEWSHFFVKLDGQEGSKSPHFRDISREHRSKWLNVGCLPSDREEVIGKTARVLNRNVIGQSLGDPGSEIRVFHGMIR